MENENFPDESESGFFRAADYADFTDGTIKLGKALLLSVKSAKSAPKNSPLGKAVFK
jgi:hypothetical protein